ncbi:MAG: PDZ domain-containing protein [Gemmatimonadaceae bacterium]
MIARIYLIDARRRTRGARWAVALALAGAAAPIGHVAPLAAQSGCANCDTAQLRRGRDAAERQRMTMLRRKLDELSRTLGQRDSLDSRTLLATQVQLQQMVRLIEQEQARSLFEARVAGTRERVVVGGFGGATAGARMIPAARRQGHPGYLGVTLSAAADTVGIDGGKRVWRFYTYPQVEAVEPGSPAERAGIAAGDVLVAFDGRDLAASKLLLDDMIRPGNRLPVRVRRDGESRTVTIAVGPRPEMSETYFMRVEGMPPTPPMPPMPPMASTEVRIPPMPPRVRITPSAVRTPATAPAPPIALVPYGFGSSTSGVAGAEVTNVRSMRDYFGVESGVLVLRVAPGTAAARADLRDGDVIVRAGGEDVESPQELRDVIGTARSGDAVPLDVVRKRERVRVVLKR